MPTETQLAPDQVRFLEWVNGLPTASPLDAADLVIVLQSSSGVLKKALAPVSGLPASDDTAVGPQISAFNCGYTSSAIGDLVYLDASGTWQKADANLSAGYDKLLAVALQVKSSGQALTVALSGSIVWAATIFPTFTVGGPIYMSETAGAMTQTQPTTTDAAIRVIGWAVHADKMFFCPSLDYITHI